jgi:hypothetical protein
MDITAAPDDNLENYIRQVKEKELDLLVVFPEDFAFAERVRIPFPISKSITIRIKMALWNYIRKYLRFLLQCSRGYLR